MDRIDLNNNNEVSDLPDQVEKCHRRFGCYPESVHADKINQTRKNRDLLTVVRNKADREKLG